MRLITPSQLSLFSISPVIGAWWQELEARKLFEDSKREADCMCELTHSLQRISGSFFATVSTSTATPSERHPAEHPTDIRSSWASRNQNNRGEQSKNSTPSMADSMNLW